MFFSPEKPVLTTASKVSVQTTSSISSQPKDKLPTYTSDKIPRLSIREAEKEAGIKKLEEEKVAQLANSNQHFDIEALKKVWKEYQLRIPEKKILLSTMDSCLLTLKDNYEIEVVVENEVQSKKLKEEMPDLMTFLSSKLNNGSIRINTRLSEIGENKNILSSEDRLKEMLERNEALRNLKQLLSLELE